MNKEKEIEKEKEIVEELVDKPMGDSDIKDIFPNAKIIMYNDLQKYNNIDEILPNPKSYAILLYLNSPNSGHWVGIMKPDKNTIEYFDSYGYPIDKPLSWISQEQNQKLGIHDNYLTNLLKKSGYKIIHNTNKYQGNGGDIATCGRHCCFRIQCMKNKNMSLQDYDRMMKNTKNKMNMGFDDLVTTMISPELE